MTNIIILYSQAHPYRFDNFLKVVKSVRVGACKRRSTTANITAIFEQRKKIAENSLCLFPNNRINTIAD